MVVVSAALEGAERIGRALAAAAVRHDGRCTWVGDEAVADEGVWRLRARTLGPELATGTAGVGWFLGRLAYELDDDSLRAIAVEALRSSLTDAEGPLGFHDGVLGVAWAALDAGAALGVEELEAAGRASAERASDARPSSSPAFYGGDAGVAAGLLAVADRTGDARLAESAAAFVPGLARTAGDLASRALRGGAPWTTDGRSLVGLATGASGIAVPLLLAGQTAESEAAARGAADAALAERAWFGSGVWNAAPFHGWAPEETAPASWCCGAAGIGRARLLAYATTGDVQALAEVSAAVEAVRGTVAAPHPPDVSLCHGLAGWVDFLLGTGVALGEESHVAAAQRVGERLLATADAVADEAVANPSLLLGAAGAGLALLRLHDPHAVSNPLDPAALARH